MQNLLAIEQIVDLKPLGRLSLLQPILVKLYLRCADLFVLVGCYVGCFDTDFVAIGHLEICLFDHHGPLVDEVMEVLRRMVLQRRRGSGDVIVLRRSLAERLDSSWSWNGFLSTLVISIVNILVLVVAAARPDTSFQFSRLVLQEIDHFLLFSGIRLLLLLNFHLLRLAEHQST